MTLAELLVLLDEIARAPSYRPRHRIAARLAAAELRRFHPPRRDPEHDPDAVTRRERLG